MPKGTGADITRGYVRHGGVKKKKTLEVLMMTSSLKGSWFERLSTQFSLYRSNSKSESSNTTCFPLMTNDVVISGCPRCSFAWVCILVILFRFKPQWRKPLQSFGELIRILGIWKSRSLTKMKSLRYSSSSRQITMLRKENINFVCMLEMFLYFTFLTLLSK